MRRQNPNMPAVELAAAALGDLTKELVLVGGCAVGLLITDAAIPPIRSTRDVDLLTEVAPLASYYLLGDRLRDRGFTESQELTCRWIRGALIIDVMPTEERVLGFTNQWYEGAAKTAVDFELPSGARIRLISAPYFLATKVESFRSRGGGDFLHHDVEDIVTLVDGRPELLDEVTGANEDVKSFIRSSFEDLVLEQAFLDVLAWHFEESEQGRVPIVLDRLRRLGGL